MYLIFDTETTGLVDFKAPFNASHQPNLVQLGAQLLDENFTVRSEINLIVKPDGWTIPKEASDVHGITTEIAQQYGIPLNSVLIIFAELFDKASYIVAHNITYDLKIMAKAINAEKWCNIPWFCTMALTTNLCKIQGPRGYKWPKLEEAYSHCFNGETFEGAHDAMADVRACARIFKYLVDNNKVPELAALNKAIAEMPEPAEEPSITQTIQFATKDKTYSHPNMVNEQPKSSITNGYIDELKFKP